MRTSRIKCDGEGIYHLISRIVDRDFKLDDEEKDIFVRMMRKAERFSGIDVLTFAVMSNHFHILIRVPEVNPEEISNEELLERYSALYGKARADMLARRWEKIGTVPEKEEKMAAERERLLMRMHDISQFMKTLKLRYSISYNKRHGRDGTLWSERFKSVIFEKGSEAMLTCARYIDNNAVRAGIVDDPKDYRWCGYSEACRGTKRAVEGIELVEQFMHQGKQISEKEALAAYGASLCVEGQALKNNYTTEEVEEMIRRDGKISEAVALRCRIRHFELGKVIGSKDFVRKIGNGVQTQVLAAMNAGEVWTAVKYRHAEVIMA